MGELQTGSELITAVLRTDAEGRRDTTYSADGFSDGPASSAGRPGRGALGFGGTVVLAAVHGTDVEVRRITSSGVADTTFMTTGRSAVVPSGAVGLTAVVRRNDGRFFLVFGGDDSTTAVHVARLTTSGALDATFSSDGYASHDAGDGHIRSAGAAALALDGDLYVFADDPSAADDPEILRFDGSNDTPPLGDEQAAVTVDPVKRGANRLDHDRRPAGHDRRPHLEGWQRRTGPCLAHDPADRRPPLTPGRSWTWPGTTLCASARARDKSAQLSPWSAQRCTSVPLTPAQLTKGKGVTTKSSAGTYTGKVLSATKKGATISRSGVRAKRLSLVVTTCPTCGKVRVYLGSDLLKTVSLKSAGTRKKVVVSIAAFVAGCARAPSRSRS